MRNDRFLPLKKTPRSALALVLSAVLLVPVAGIAASYPEPPAMDVDSMSKEMLDAMRRDLGMSKAQVAEYIRVEDAAIASGAEARMQLGESFAGDWLERDKDGRFTHVIATTDAAKLAPLRALGVEFKVVEHSIGELDRIMDQLNQASKQGKSNEHIHSWYIDVRSNRVVVAVERAAIDAAIDFVALSGADARAVTFEDSAEQAQTFYDVIGGDGFHYSTSATCSVGFSVTKNALTGYVTAGHCANTGLHTTRGMNEVAQGQFVAKSFPGNDYAWVQVTNGAWLTQPWVTKYAGGTLQVLGKLVAPVGAAVCRSGIVSQYRCGTIQATNVTVIYGVSEVFGLTKTNTCAGSGDSGGAFVTPGGQAQGVTSGGSPNSFGGDNCGFSNTTTYFQPLQPILTQYGLTLSLATPPTISSFNCPDLGSSGSGQYDCDVLYSSGSPVTVTWSGDSGVHSESSIQSTFTGQCISGDSLRMTVTIANAYGSATRTSALFPCPTGPIP